MPIPINNFTVIESVYGKFLVNRHCTFQAEYLIKTGYPHIQSELKKILLITESLPANCVVVDAGANIGLVGIPIAQNVRAKGGVVHAFEVQRMMFYALCGSTALNDLENLYVNNVALGSSAGKLKVPKVDYGKPQDFGMLSLSDQASVGAYEEVAVTTVDNLGLPRLDFFKIDVEGMEIDVLKGAQNSIQRYKPWVWIEYWKVAQQDIRNQFAGLDYKYFVMDQLNMLCAPTERLNASQIKITASEAV